MSKNETTEKVVNEEKAIQLSASAKMLKAKAKRITVEKLDRDPELNPRIAGDNDFMVHLPSILDVGIRNPLVVSKRPDDTLMVLQGNLRCQAIEYIFDKYNAVVTMAEFSDRATDEEKSCYDAYQAYFVDGIPCQVITDLTPEEEAVIANDFDRAGRSKMAIYDSMIASYKAGLSEKQVSAKHGAELLSFNGIVPDDIKGYKTAETPAKRAKILFDKYRGHTTTAKQLALELPPIAYEYYRNNETNQPGPILKHSQIGKLATANRDLYKDADGKISPEKMIQLTGNNATINSLITKTAGENAGTVEKKQIASPKTLQQAGQASTSYTMKSIITALLSVTPVSEFDSMFLDLEKTGTLPSETPTDDMTV